MPEKTHHKKQDSISSQSKMLRSLTRSKSQPADIIFHSKLGDPSSRKTATKNEPLPQIKVKVASKPEASSPTTKPFGSFKGK
jgi:hypothetical protein